MMYTAKVKGNFVETQTIEADSVEEATEKLIANEGETLMRESATDIEVSDVEEVEEEML